MEIIKEIYDQEKGRRFLIIKEDKNMYSYRLELLTSINGENNELQWMPPCCCMSHSLFMSEEDALNDIHLTEEYAKYF